MTDNSASALHRALNKTTPIWGGWITGPTLIGPEEFARAGYDYVGFDAQHGYLDDADISGILRRLEHVPIATAVRLPNADPAPIGRVLDAGADAVFIAMIESADQAAAAVAATRYAPAGIRSFGPLRPSLGCGHRHARVPGERVRDDRNGRGAGRADRNLRGGRPGRNLCRPCRFGHLDGRRRRRGNQEPRRAATRSNKSIPRPPLPGWSPGFTPATARPVMPWRSWGFR